MGGGGWRDGGGEEEEDGERGEGRKFSNQTRSPSYVPAFIMTSKLHPSAKPITKKATLLIRIPGSMRYRIVVKCERVGG